MSIDPLVQARRLELVTEAQITLKAIAALAYSNSRDPLVDARVLAESVKHGILDAPQLRNNPFGRGQVTTHIIQGKCLAVDPNGRPLSESERLKDLVKEYQT
jgi:hypothetical protein